MKCNSRSTIKYNPLERINKLPSSKNKIDGAASEINKFDSRLFADDLSFEFTNKEKRIVSKNVGQLFESKISPVLLSNANNVTIANKIVKKYTLISAFSILSPNPILDGVFVSCIDLKMLQELFLHFDQDFDKNLVKSVVLSISGGLVTTVLGYSLRSVITKSVSKYGIPFSMLSQSLIAATSTYTLGMVFVEFFSNGKNIEDLNLENIKGYTKLVFK